MFEKRLKDPTVLKLLSQVLLDSKTEKKVSSVSPNGEKGMYNLYSMMILIDAIIKYQIMVGSSTYFETYVNKLTQLVSLYKNHKELVVGVQSLLGEMVRYELGIPDLIKYEHKKVVLEYIYQRYIVNGYCFHSFPSVFKETVESNGIDFKNYQYPVKKMKQIAYIFENHYYKNFITKNLEEKKLSFSITDSPLMAYYYALSAPSYFSDMTATSDYMDDETYDRFAYYRRDYEACKRNLETIGKHIGLSNREQEIVEDAFIEQWNTLKISKSTPCIAFIQRSAVGRNKLDHFQKILEDAKHEDFVVSLSKITDSRYSQDEYFTPILSLDFTVEEMPTYQEIVNGYCQETKKVELTDVFKEKTVEATSIRIKQKEDMTEKDTLFLERPANNYGYADVVALCGILSIISGLTLFLILNYFGIR